MAIYTPPTCILRAAKTRTISSGDQTYYGLLGSIKPASVVKIGRIILVVTLAEEGLLGASIDQIRARRNARKFRWVLSTRLFSRYEYRPVLLNASNQYLAVDIDL